MKTKRNAIIGLVSIFVVGASITAFTFLRESKHATCYGKSPCNACKNCKYCGHCAKNGGTCGVCK